jgi:hypothetical protein
METLDGSDEMLEGAGPFFFVAFLESDESGQPDQNKFRCMDVRLECKELVEACHAFRGTLVLSYVSK